MKITEINLPHLFLDMDGVQCDFFGEWVRRDKVAHWKALEQREEEIYRLAHSSSKEVCAFFAELYPLQSGDDLLSWIYENNIPFTILSAPLRGPYHEASIQGKISWLDENRPGASATAIFTSEKEKYAVTNGIPNILIDDWDKNLIKWNNAGGIGIKFEDEFEVSTVAADVIKVLTRLYHK